MNHKMLTWDSEKFGHNVAITSEGLTLSEISSELLKLKEANVKLVYIPSVRPLNRSTASGYKIHLADQKIVYTESIPSNQPTAIDSHIYHIEKCCKNVIELSILAGKQSRFSTDTRVKKSIFQSIYTDWIANSINKTIADHTFGYRLNNKLCGLLTLGKKNDRADIGLIAVSESAQGKGIGMSLINAARITARRTGHKELQVVTQNRNFQAKKFYSHCGFQLESSTHLYHAWLI